MPMTPLSDIRYEEYLVVELDRLFEICKKIDPTTTLFKKYVLSTKVAHKVDGEITSIPLTHEYEKSIMHHRTSDDKELFFLLRNELKTLVDKQDRMNAKGQSQYRILREITNMRPECPKVRLFLHAYRKIHARDEKLNWVITATAHAFSYLWKEFEQISGERKVIQLDLAVTYVNRHDLDKEITLEGASEFQDYCNSCGKCQTTARKLQVCGCEKVFYCNQECQDKDYPAHKETCQPAETPRYSIFN